MVNFKLPSEKPRKNRAVNSALRGFIFNFFLNTLLLLGLPVKRLYLLLFSTRYKTIKRANNFYPSVEKWELFGLHSSSLQSSFANLPYTQGEVKLKIKKIENL